MHRLHLQLSDELWERLSHEAEQERTAVSELIRSRAERDEKHERPVNWTGDPLLKLKGRLRTRERLCEALWRMVE